MNIVLKTLWFFSFLLLNIQTYSQDDYTVVKIDNSNFPDIEMIIRANDSFDSKEFTLYENDKSVDFIIDTLSERFEKRELSVLFVIKQNTDDEMKSALVKTIRTLTYKDKMNLAIILDQDTSDYLLHYVSPDFTRNKGFFINFLEQGLYKNIKYDQIKKRDDIITESEEIMFAEQDVYSNRAFIFLSDELQKKREIYSSVFSDKTVPIYFLLTKETNEKEQNKLIELSIQTGGIFTVSAKKDLERFLRNYLEDISLHSGNFKTKSYRIAFRASQYKDKNLLSIDYGGKISDYFYTKPVSYMLNKRERVLIALSVVMFFTVLFFYFSGKRKIIEAKKIKGITGTFFSDSKNNTIEINVKTEGFNKTYFFEKPIIKIGRSSDNDIIIPDRTVSGTHAVINKEGEFYLVQDTGSTNGVFVNQKKITKQKLKSKDKIKLGSAVLIVKV